MPKFLQQRPERPDPIYQPLAVSIIEAARLTGIPAARIYHAAQKNEIPSQVILGRRVILMSELKALLSIREGDAP